MTEQLTPEEKYGNPLYIVGLQLENCMKIKAFEMKPDDYVTVLEGPNRAGKSAVVRGLAMILGGGKQIPDVPIRRGANELRGHVSLGPKLCESATLEVYLRITQKGGATLIIKDKEGLTVSETTQSLLGRFRNEFTFDPIAFKALPAKKQLEVLNRVLGLDFAEHDKTHKGIFEKRTVNNRTLSLLAAGISKIVAKPDEYPTFIEVSKLAEAHEANELLKANRERALSEQAFAQQETQRMQSKFGDEVKRLQAELDDSVERLKSELAEAESHVATASAALDECVAPDDNANLTEQIEHATAVNTSIADYVNFVDRKKVWKTCLADSETMTAQLQALDDAKAKARADAKFPVEGMGVTDDGITLDGLPFDQASSEEQITACFQLGLADNPTLRFMACTNASMIDKNSLATLTKVAKDCKVQLLLEMVALEPSGNAIFIEDGLVLEQEQELAADTAKVGS